MSAEKVPLPGSNRQLPANAKVISPYSGDLVQVSVVVRRRTPLPSIESLSGQRISREEFARKYGADPVDIEKVEAFARAHSLTVLSSNAATRTVVISGKPDQMESTFGVKLVSVQAGEQTFRTHQGMIYLPADLQTIVEAVLGLDNRPAAIPRA